MSNPPKRWTECLTIIETSTTPSCNESIPAQILQGTSEPVPVYSHTMPKMDFYYFHRSSCEKHSKLIYHIPWLYQEQHKSPFIGPIIFFFNIMKNYPPWTMEILKWNVSIPIVIVGKKRSTMPSCSGNRCLQTNWTFSKFETRIGHYGEILIWRRRFPFHSPLCLYK